MANSVSEAEKKRQEAINEVIYTEKDFVRDLEYLRDVRYCIYLLLSIDVHIFLVINYYILVLDGSSH